MPFNFPDVAVDAAIVHSGVAVFPLRLAVEGQLNYALSFDAMAVGMVHVAEVNPVGSVGNLLITNRGSQCVLFLEGECFQGAKQDRTLNTSVLVPPQCQLVVPVSCVERFRWDDRTSRFESSAVHVSAKLRHALKASVGQSLARGHGHRSDQERVWRTIQEEQETLQVASSTQAWKDTIHQHGATIAELLRAFPYPSGSCGVAIVSGSESVLVDLFDKAATCQALWNRLISSAIAELSPVLVRLPVADRTIVTQFVDCLQTTKWSHVPTVGFGEEYRTNADHHMHASALAVQGALVHLSAHRC